jgi:hypothetical protein
MSRKKLKKAAMKVSSTGVRRVPSAFDDDTLTETDSLKGVFFWPVPYFRDSCPAGFENEFVDVDSFSDAALKSERRHPLLSLRSMLLLLKLLFALSPLLLPKALLLRSLPLTKPPPNSPRTLSALFKGGDILPKIFLWSRFGRSSPKTRRLLLP